MIMINSNSAQKLGKPPPPVPPRPSKSVVAEALAKSRHHNKAISIKEAEKTKSPSRQAPPPPTPRNEVVKSKSSFSINIPLKKPAVYERSISEEIKNSTRPVIYQSSNAKCNNINNNNNCVQITRQDSDVKIVNNSVGGFRNNHGVQVFKKVEKLEEECRNRVQVSRKESVKREKNCAEKFIENSVSVTEERDVNDARSKSSSSTLEKSSDSGKYGSTSSLDANNWDQMLNDRNHVNTLIDEMFASVLEVQFSDDNSTTNENNNNNVTNSLSEDKTEIIISSAAEIDYENVKFDNGVVVSGADIGESNVPKTVIVIKNDSPDMEDAREEKKRVVLDASSTNSAERQKQVKFKDQLNHELLINELQCMKQDQEKILKRQRKPSMNLYENSAVPNSESTAKVSRPDWMDMQGGGREAKLNTCQIEITDDQDEKEEQKGFILDYERIIKMSSLHGLPPLPKSLSGFSLLERHQGGATPPTPMRSSSMRSSSHLVYPPHPKVNGEAITPQLGGGTSGRKSTNLDAQLAILRREMYSLRQLDLSLLSQLWSLNESIQDFRQILQDQEDRVLSPPSPSPTPSSGEDMDGDEFYMSASSLNFRPAPPPPRRPSSSSNASSLG